MIRTPSTHSANLNRYYLQPRRPVSYWIYDGDLLAAKYASHKSVSGRILKSLCDKLKFWHHRSGQSVDIPKIAVKVVTTKERYGELWDFVDDCFNSNVAAVWLLDPFLKTVSVYHKTKQAFLLTINDDLTDPELPGFRCPVSELFE